MLTVLFRKGRGREKEMNYVDGFVLAVPTANQQRFLDHANSIDAIFLELGALRVLECWGDDVPTGKLTDFHRAVQARSDETVVFSLVEWPDKPTRDAAVEKMMKDPRMDPKASPMPFDGKRMIYGGFKPILELTGSEHLKRQGEGKASERGSNVRH